MTNAEATVRGAIQDVLAQTAHLTGITIETSLILIDSLVLRIRNGPDHWAFVALAAPGAHIEEAKKIIATRPLPDVL
jgi:hypothetical protein